MTPEQQKERARDFMRALDRSDRAKLDELAAPNFRFELMTRPPGSSEVFDREAFLTTLVDMLQQIVPKGFNFAFDHAIAEGPHVSMQGTCDTVAYTGKKYSNRYHWYFRFAGDKIEVCREYLDACVAAEAFAP